MASSLKNTKLKLDLLTDIDLSLMVERPARGGICLAIHRYAKTNNKYMQIMIKIKNHHISSFGM